MIFLGLDPGTIRIGYGVVAREGASFRYRAGGILDVSGNLHERLSQIEPSLKKLVRQFRPDMAIIETLIFAKNKKTAMQVAEGRGALIATLVRCGLPLIELAPSSVKAAVAGSGNASKQAVAKMVWYTLQMPPPEESLVDDATDALALAIAGALHHTHPQYTSSKRSP